MQPEIQDRLKAERVQGRLLELPDWQLSATCSEAVEWHQTFSSFNQVIEILVDIALWVERHGRIPDISVRGNGLTVRLGMNGLTEDDFDLARTISNSC